MQSPSKTEGDQKNCIFPTELVVLQPTSPAAEQLILASIQYWPSAGKEEQVSQSFEHSLQFTLKSL